MSYDETKTRGASQSELRTFAGKSRAQSKVVAPKFVFTKVLKVGSARTPRAAVDSSAAV